MPTNTKPHTKKTTGNRPSREFQRQLLRFYRTGVNPSGYADAKLRSVFHPYFASLQDPYPYSLGQVQVPHDDELLDRMIVHHLADFQEQVVGKFKKQLNELIERLSIILSIEQEQGEDEDTYDFATQLIAFDKLAEIAPSQALGTLNEKRRSRLTKVVKRIKRGLKSYSKVNSVLVRTMSSYATVGSSENMQVITASRKQALAEVKEILQHNMKTFTTLMKSFHIALLEVEDAYREEVHVDYFKHFSWYWLSDEEKQLMQPVFLMLDESYAKYHLDDLSELLRTNWPVKVLLLNPQLASRPSDSIKWEQATHSIRMELATFAIAHRSVCLHQLTSADPHLLSDALQQWVACTGPTMIHLLMPENGSRDEYLATMAAPSARYFPNLGYLPKSQDPWDLTANPQSKEKWPRLGLEAEDALAEKEERTFTYADYKAFTKEKVQELMLIPEQYTHDDLISLHDYLELAMQDRVGKVPFILLVDEAGKQYRAAVPYVWVVSCEERMEFWRFLQGISGSAAADSTDEPTEKKSNLQVTPQSQISDKEKAEIEQRAFVRAVERLVSELLNDKR